MQDYRITTENENAKHGLGPGHNRVKVKGKADVLKTYSHPFGRCLPVQAEENP